MRSVNNKLKYTLKSLIFLVFLIVPSLVLAEGAPMVTTHPASSIGETYANLNGYFNPNGTQFTKMWFEYGESASGAYSNSVTVNLYGGLNTQAYSNPQRILNLKKDAFYYFRACAQNTFGMNCGLTYSFKTGPNPISGGATAQTTQPSTSAPPPAAPAYYYPTQPGQPYGYYAPTVNNVQPVVVSHSPTSITQTSAKLNGTLVLNSNLPTDGWFDWGTTNSLGSNTAKRQIATQIGSYNFEEIVADLNPDTFYYMQAVAENSNGITRGNVFSFRTLARAPITPTTIPEQATSQPQPSPAPQPASPSPITEAPAVPAPADSLSPESRAASVFFSGLFPDSLSGWILGIFLAILLFLVGWHSRRMYERRLREIQNLENLK